MTCRRRFKRDRMSSSSHSRRRRQQFTASFPTGTDFCASASRQGLTSKAARPCRLRRRLPLDLLELLPHSDSAPFTAVGIILTNSRRAICCIPKYVSVMGLAEMMPCHLVSVGWFAYSCLLPINAWTRIPHDTTALTCCPTSNSPSCCLSPDARRLYFAQARATLGHPSSLRILFAGPVSQNHARFLVFGSGHSGPGRSTS